MVETKVKIGELFQAISELENISFRENEEVFQKNKILIKDENSNYKNVPGLIKKRDKIRTIDFGTTKVKCADKHKICFDPQTGECTMSENLIPGFNIKTVDGNTITVISNNVSSVEEFVYDLEIETDNHLYQTSNGIVHHNTHLVRKLAETMGLALHQFDMSEYQEKHAVAKLIGAPAGYVGYEEGGLLVDAIRKEPHSILLLDEIEKAHSDIYNILLQMMDYATLTDNQGRKADFRNVIIIMTSNAGARNIGSKPVGFGSVARGGEAVDTAVEKTFTPEFRNRLDKVVTFNDLTPEVIKEVVKAEIREFETMLTEKGVKLTVTDAALDWFVKNGYSEKFGARPISRLIDEKIKDIFVDAVLFGDLKNGGSAEIDIDGDEIKVNTLNLSIDNAVILSV